MMCTDCHGKGGHPFYAMHLISNLEQVVIGSHVCPTCAGRGVIHCCEGDRADQAHPQPDAPGEQQCLSTTAGQPTGHPDPTS